MIIGASILSNLSVLQSPEKPTGNTDDTSSQAVTAVASMRANAATKGVKLPRGSIVICRKGQNHSRSGGRKCS
jgi:hypothetical protein